jgi:hypothetical protein
MNRTRDSQWHWNPREQTAIQVVTTVVNTAVKTVVEKTAVKTVVKTAVKTVVRQCDGSYGQHVHVPFAWFVGSSSAPITRSFSAIQSLSVLTSGRAANRS